MKYISLSFCLCFSLSAFACSCISEQSFCNLIKDQFFAENGIVCIVESTGNVAGDYDFSATEVKIVNLLFGEVEAGNGNYLNTDTTLWILAGQGATCYDSAFTFSNAGEQFVIASSFGQLYLANNSIEFGYSIYLCAHDSFRYGETMTGPLINNYELYYGPGYAADTVTSNELPALINDCILCKPSLNLPGPHEYPSSYIVSSTILSTATINSNVIYKANDRVTLFNGFKTNAPYSFSVEMEGCD